MIKHSRYQRADSLTGAPAGGIPGNVNQGFNRFPVGGNNKNAKGACTVDKQRKKELIWAAKERIAHLYLDLDAAYQWEIPDILQEIDAEEEFLEKMEE